MEVKVEGTPVIVIIGVGLFVVMCMAMFTASFGVRGEIASQITSAMVTLLAAQFTGTIAILTLQQANKE